MQLLVGKHLDGDSYDPKCQGKATLGDLTTGPRGFLAWFGNLVGVVDAEAEQERVLAYQTALDKVGEGFYLPSFKKDSLGVAKRLLALRDDIYLSAPSSFDLRTMKCESARLATLVEIEKLLLGEPPRDGEPERLRRIIARLTSGLKHPVHTLVLLENETEWQRLWQELWGALAATGAAVSVRKVHPTKADSTDLRGVQEAMSGQPSKRHPIANDQSIIHIRASYLSEAADAVAAILDASRKEEIVIIRGKESRVLDLGLGRAGLPALGHHEVTSGHPVRNLLPVILDLSIAPTNPNLLKEFLHIEPSPLSKSLRSSVDYALNRRAGWPHTAATTVIDDFVEKFPMSHDGEPITDKIKDEWHQWLALADQTDTGLVTKDRLLKNLDLLSDFARRAQKGSKLDEEARIGLAVLKRDIDAFRDFIEPAGRSHYSRIELQGVLGKVAADGHVKMQREASPLHAVDHPSALLGPVDTVIYWMGLQSTAPRSVWKILVPSELKQLAEANVQFMPESLRHQEHASAVRGTLNFARKRFILVTTDRIGDEPEEPLPIWYEIQQVFAKEATVQPQDIKTFMTSTLPKLGGKAIATTPRQFPNFQSSWELGPEHLVLRDQESPSSVEKLIGCPLNWVLNYVAGLRDRPSHSFTMGPLLSGNVAHKVAQNFFERGSLAEPESVQRQRLNELFEREVEEAAGILGVKGNEFERLQTKTKVVDGLLSLAGLLNRSGYAFEACELEVVDDTPAGKIGGRIDLLVHSRKNPNDKVIIDLKWGSKADRENQIKDGLATQLAIYSRLLGKGKTWPKTAFFILYSASVVTAHRHLFEGVYASDGPDEKSVWQAVEEELKRTIAEFRNGTVSVGVPSERAIGLEGTGRAFPAPCKYCSNSMYCQTARREAA